MLVYKGIGWTDEWIQNNGSTNWVCQDAISDGPSIGQLGKMTKKFGQIKYFTPTNVLFPLSSFKVWEQTLYIYITWVFIYSFIRYKVFLAPGRCWWLVNSWDCDWTSAHLSVMTNRGKKKLASLILFT